MGFFIYVRHNRSLVQCVLNGILGRPVAAAQPEIVFFFYFCRFSSAVVAVGASVTADDTVCLRKRQVLNVSDRLYWRYLECTTYTKSWCA